MIVDFLLIKVVRKEYATILSSLCWIISRREKPEVTGEVLHACMPQLQEWRPEAHNMSIFNKVRRPDIAALLGTSYDDVRASPMSATSRARLPLVYSSRYNIHFWGLEKIHPFDSCKFKKIVDTLVGQGLFDADSLIEPKEVTREVLEEVHTAAYIDKIHTSSLKVAQVTEMAILASVPNWLLQRQVITPMKVMVGGTILAAALAIEFGWAINIGGGMHHAHSSNGGGWCAFSDIYLSIQRIRATSQGKIKKVLYIDLDAHQGNGVERDKISHQDQDLLIIDLYNGSAYPQDHDAKAAIDINHELKNGEIGIEYLARLQSALDEAVDRFPQVDLVFFNAGTDVLVNDPLGRLRVEEEEVVKRDEMVWEYALDKFKAPIVMVLSGGYSKRTAAVVTDSISNLIRKFNLNQL